MFNWKLPNDKLRFWNISTSVYRINIYFKLFTFRVQLYCESQILRVASDIWTLYTITLEESWQRRVNLKPALPGTMSSLLMDFIKRELNKSAKHAETREDYESVRYLWTCFRIHHIPFSRNSLYCMTLHAALCKLHWYSASRSKDRKHTSY